MIIKYYLFLIILFFCICCFSNDTVIAQRQNNNTSSEQKTVDLQLFKKQILKRGKLITKKLKTKNMRGIRIITNSSIIEHWSNSPYIEKATGIKSSWYKKISRQLRELANYKIQMETAEERNQNNRYKTALKNYKKELNKYLKIINNPEKVRKDKKNRPSYNYTAP
jgi:hypothetical protein